MQNNRLRGRSVEAFSVKVGPVVSSVPRTSLTVASLSTVCPSVRTIESFHFDV